MLKHIICAASISFPSYLFVGKHIDFKFKVKSKGMAKHQYTNSRSVSSTLKIYNVIFCKKIYSIDAKDCILNIFKN